MRSIWNGFLEIFGGSFRAWKKCEGFLAAPHESSALRNQSPGPGEGGEEEGLRERWAGGSSDSSPFVPGFYQECKTVDQMYRLHLSRFPSSLVHWPGTFFVAGEGVFCSLHLIWDPHVVVHL